MRLHFLWRKVIDLVMMVLLVMDLPMSLLPVVIYLLPMVMLPVVRVVVNLVMSLVNVKALLASLSRFLMVLGMVASLLPRQWSWSYVGRTHLNGALGRANTRDLESEELAKCAVPQEDGTILYMNKKGKLETLDEREKRLAHNSYVAFSRSFDGLSLLLH